MAVAAGADEPVGGAIVVFAKCPTAGASKTRLAPMLGEEGAATLARSMLSDVLVSLSECPQLKGTLKVLMYAPSTKDGELQMTSIVQSLHLATKCAESEQFNFDEWVLLPMKSSTPSDLTSSSLGDKLEDALERTRELLAKSTVSAAGAVLFLGMDSPELHLDEIVHGLRISSSPSGGGKAHLCPANDGGYGLLSVPMHARASSIFAGVRWSHPLTALSQLKALTDANVDVTLGKLMHDIDEPEDVLDLAKRLVHSRNTGNEVQCLNETDVLTRPPVETSQCAKKAFPFHTWKRLMELGIIQELDGGTHSVCDTG